MSKSVVQNEAELREVVREMVAKYQQPALVEEYIGAASSRWGCSASAGRGCSRPMEIVFLDTDDTNPVYSFQHKLDWNDRIRYDVPGQARAQPAEKLQHGGARVPSWPWAAATWPGSTSAWTRGAGSTSSSATRCPG